MKKSSKNEKSRTKPSVQVRDLKAKKNPKGGKLAEAAAKGKVFKKVEIHGS